MLLHKLRCITAVLIMIVCTTNLYAEEKLSHSENRAEVLVAFDPFTEGLPESITTDRHGHIYASMGPTNTVRKFDPNGALLAIYTIPVSPGSFSAGIEVNFDGDIFVNVFGNGNAEAHGIWEIKPNGEVSKFVDIEPTGFLNGITIDIDDNLYVSDTGLAKIIKIDPAGNISDWLIDSILTSVNGIQLNRSQRYIYGVSMNNGIVFRVKIRKDGSAGKIKEIANDSMLIGADGITFDRRGRLYVAVNEKNSIIRLSRKGKISVIDQHGALDFPADVTFGKGRNAFTLYIANASLINFSDPALLKIGRETRSLK